MAVSGEGTLVVGTRGTDLFCPLPFLTPIFTGSYNSAVHMRQPADLA